MNKPKPKLDKIHALEPKKICTKCGGDPKPLSEFYRKKTSKDGHVNACKTCKREINRKGYNKVKPKPPKREEVYYAPSHTMSQIIKRIQALGIPRVVELTTIPVSIVTSLFHEQYEPRSKQRNELEESIF